MSIYYPPVQGEEIIIGEPLTPGEAAVNQAITGIRGAYGADAKVVVVVYGAAEGNAVWIAAGADPAEAIKEIERKCKQQKPST